MSLSVSNSKFSWDAFSFKEIYARHLVVEKKKNCPFFLKLQKNMPLDTEKQTTKRTLLWGVISVLKSKQVLTKCAQPR